MVAQKTGIYPTPEAFGVARRLSPRMVPLCWTHHRAYDTRRLELLPHLEPQRRAEVAHAVSHLGLIGAVRRLAPGRR